MFKLDNEFLTSLGLGSLPVAEKNKLLQHIYERLEMNVGMRLAEKMSDQQLDEFEGFIDRNDEAGALKWLETNFPNYKQVVAEELDKLKEEVRQAAPQIIAASQSNPVAPQPAAPEQPQQFQQPNPYGAPGSPQQFQQPQPNASPPPPQNYSPNPAQPYPGGQQQFQPNQTAGQPSQLTQDNYSPQPAPQPQPEPYQFQPPQFPPQPNPFAPQSQPPQQDSQSQQDWQQNSQAEQNDQPPAGPAQQ